MLLAVGSPRQQDLADGIPAQGGESGPRCSLKSLPTQAILWLHKAANSFLTDPFFSFKKSPLLVHFQVF